MMNHELIVEHMVTINKSSDIVWKALIDPGIFKHYFFGVELSCDWKVGSEIVFSGEFGGKGFRDYGKILEIVPGKIVRYSYYSAFSGLEAKPENYSEVIYKLEEDTGKTILKLVQRGFANEDSREHSAGAWKMVLDNMKQLLEKN